MTQDQYAALGRSLSKVFSEPDGQTYDDGYDAGFKAAAKDATDLIEKLEAERDALRAQLDGGTRGADC